MVCVPCIFIPVLLFIWHRFIQPYVLKFWNPWAVKDDKGNVTETKFPFTCAGGACPFPSKSAKPAVESTSQDNSDASKTDREKSE